MQAVFGIVPVYQLSNNPRNQTVSLLFSEQCIGLATCILPQSNIQNIVTILKFSNDAAAILCHDLLEVILCCSFDLAFIEEEIK